MQSKNNWKAWLYLAPTLILMTVFTFYPLINTIGISFLKNYNYTTQTSSGFTFDNYAIVLRLQPIATLAGMPIFEDNVVNFAIPNTFIITFVTVPISILISLLISIALNQIKALQRFFQTIYFLPYVTNAIAVGMVFNVIFAHNGVFNYIFGVGDKYWIDVTAQRADGMFALCVYIIWQSLPYKILIFSSGLQGIDQQYYDAAKMDSAPRWKVISRITIPLLSPQILYIMITSFIGAFKEYTNIVGLFGAPQTSPSEKYNMYTVVYYIYDMLKLPQRVAWACAAAVLLFIVILIFTVIELQVSKRRVHY